MLSIIGSQNLHILLTNIKDSNLYIIGHRAWSLFNDESKYDSVHITYQTTNRILNIVIKYILCVYVGLSISGFYTMTTTDCGW